MNYLILSIVSKTKKNQSENENETTIPASAPCLQVLERLPARSCGVWQPVRVQPVFNHNVPGVDPPPLVNAPWHLLVR